MTLGLVLVGLLKDHQTAADIAAAMVAPEPWATAQAVFAGSDAV